MNRKNTRLLVKSILKEDTQKANKLLAKIIAEAEEDRQEEARAEANEELGIQDQEEEQNNEISDDEDFDNEGLENDNDDQFESLDDSSDEETDEFSAQDQITTSDTELNELVDKQVNFEVQINNLVLNDLQNQCADLKVALENNTALDKHSREYYEIQVPLQYYAEHLSDIQKQVNPLVNQDGVKKQLDEIKSSLQELADKISNGGDSDDFDTISTPDQIMADQEADEFDFK